MKESTDLLNDVIKKVSLKSVYTKSASCMMFVLPEHVSPKNTDVSIEYKFKHQVFDDKPYELVCFIIAGITAKTKKGTDLFNAIGDEKVFELSCTIVVRYSLTDTKLSKESLELFTKKNAMFNAYPFMRENVHSNFSKMGLHGFFLPLLKADIKTEKKKTKKKIAKKSKKITKKKI